MSNPWGVKLKKTGFNESRLANEQFSKNMLEQKQNELQNIVKSNEMKQNIYEDRQASLSADAMAGQQGRLPGQGGKKRRTKRRHSKRRHSKTRYSRRRHSRRRH